jgi:hypothetical protein
MVDYTTFFNTHKNGQLEDTEYVINRIKEEIIGECSARLIRTFDNTHERLTKA